MAEPAVGFIGIGRMGLPMAAHVLNAGRPVIAFDIAPDAAKTAEEKGITLAASAKDVGAACDVTFVVVPSDEDTLSATTGEAGVLAGARPGSLVAVCASVRPETVQYIAAEATARDVRILDMPLTKGIRGAVAGTMTLLVGGDAEDLERIRPITDCFSTAVHHVGGIGAGQIAKTVNNILLWSNLAAAREALVLGRALGLEPAALRDAMLDCSADSWVLREFEKVRPVWPAKDMANALKLAADADCPMPVANKISEAVKDIDVAALHDLIPQQ